MRISLLVAATCILSACASQPQSTGVSAPSSATALVHLTDGGDFIELQRAADYSTVQVRKAPEGSVPSSMFALRGSCAVTRARGELYFASVLIAGGTREYRLTFPKSATESQLRGSAKSVFALAECALLRF
jgi:hypothetical protein